MAFSPSLPVRWIISKPHCSSLDKPRSNITTTMSLQTDTAAQKPGPKRAAKIVCIGDIHGEWGDADETALCALKPDLALFVGDYGNEDVELTKRLAAFASSVNFQIVTVFGNHDAHYTAFSQRRTRSLFRTDTGCAVSQQIRALKPYDASYRSISIPNVGLSVCGGRPFSLGGPKWQNAAFYKTFFGVTGLQDSAAKIASAAKQATFGTLIFLSHSGPKGLGGRPNDPCGKDWSLNPGGDYGDPDLRRAIIAAREAGLRVPLVVFGHMHRPLQNGFGTRIMLKTESDGRNGAHTVMLNAAIVPRHRPPHHNTPPLYNFQIVNLKNSGDVATVEECWVTAQGSIFESSVMYDDSENEIQQEILGETVKSTRTQKVS